ncbi:MBL fold metallo-hydrolase [Dysgonomonas sp. 25]|uniref:MBL fold metallo-hydrolase n=1 Tax=Dysgonomonas sp. 25 TaxID=2302933 RepID=UPI0013D1F835|nr:MBL fold metallo-hydrolase [Dysgonomonas sp. 25]NDV68380.1 MBL fold metallo-hydrolase [Dysgonomonas sp. 25]
MKKWKTKNGYNIIQLLSGRSNVFLLSHNNTTILIDTSSKANWNNLSRKLDSIGIVKIDYLILTHTHHDHAANAQKIRAKYKASVIVHKSEADYLANGKAILPKGTTFFTRIIGSLGKRIEHRFNYEPCPYDIKADSYLDLSMTGINAYLFHTPGHSIGSVSLIIDNEIAIVGDTLFGIFNDSIFPPYADNVNQLIDSWKGLLSTGCKIFLPSHGSSRDNTQLEREYNKRIRTEQ